VIPAASIWLSEMPAQPLGKTKAVKHMTFGAGALRSRPDLAIHVAAVIESWASAEARLLGIVAYLLKADPDVAVAMLLTVESQATQRAIVLAAAGSVLKPRDLSLFTAVVRSTVLSREIRNHFAHHLWGVSAELPDALLLVDPKHRNITLAALEKWRRAKQTEGRDAGPQPNSVDRSDIYVWREPELEEAHMAALSAASNFTLLTILVARDFPTDETGEAIRRQLSAIPYVRRQLQLESQQSAQKAQAAEQRVTQPTKLSSAQRRTKAMKTLEKAPKKAKELPPSTDENEVLRRMLHTPPKPHKVKAAPAKKRSARKATP